jgi:hypothetical protein
MRGNPKQSSRDSQMHKQVEITLADPVFDPQRQISRKFFWSRTADFSHRYGMIFV